MRKRFRERSVFGGDVTIYDNDEVRAIADVLNELHDRLLALESRLERDDSHAREQNERGRE